MQRDFLPKKQEAILKREEPHSQRNGIKACMVNTNTKISVYIYVHREICSGICLSLCIFSCFFYSLFARIFRFPADK